MDKQLNTDARDGVIAGLVAYLIWGLLPVYFTMTAAIAPFEVLTHRVIWAVPFGALILYFRKQFPEVRSALLNRTMMAWLLLSATVIAANWFIYIWAIQAQRIFETSLGYYISPFTHMLAGLLFLGERMRFLQVAATLIAAIGVLFLAISGGAVPWVAFGLALSFTTYAVIRKRVAIGGMPGLFIETLILLPFAVSCFFYFYQIGSLQFVDADSTMRWLLILAGPVTALPLLCFALSARRLSMTTIGFMQFMSPTMQFAVGVFYGEILTVAHWVCFVCIWTAVGFFIFDALRARKKKPLQTSSARA